MTAGPGEDDPLISALVLELTDLRGKVTELEQGHSGDQVKLRELSDLLQNTISTMAGGQQPTRTGGGAPPGYGPDGGVGEDGRYQPAPAPQWWRMDEAGRQQVLGRLSWWVETVYRPGYGHLAAKLPQCWDQHDLCLYLLDLLSQLHTVLYQNRGPAPEGKQDGELLERTPAILSSAAEWHLRLLPTAVSLMAAETASCPHARATATARWGTR